MICALEDSVGHVGEGNLLRDGGGRDDMPSSANGVLLEDGGDMGEGGEQFDGGMRRGGVADDGRSCGS